MYTVREALDKMAYLTMRKKISELTEEEKELQRELANVIVNDPYYTAVISCSILDQMALEEAKKIIKE